MVKNILLGSVVLVTLGMATPSLAAEGHSSPELPDMEWSFKGPFGAYDRGSLQRGFQVYKQVCSACHSMKRVHYRNLEALGYDESQIKAVAGEYMVTDGPNDEGDMFERAARPSDHFKSPFANDQAAKFANNGALPPDLSLIVKARADGANYVYGILTGYEAVPEGEEVTPSQHWNKYFPGHKISMAAPLVEGDIAYDDGTEGTVDQYAKDVVTFLSWASEPEMEERKQTGIKVILFLMAFAGIMYAVKKKIWADLH
jgi:ubiquinol-cytochrome c reductase cytochrome c1 subunit